MNKTKKKNRKKVDTVKSVNNSIRTSVRKLNPILKSIVGKKVDVAIRDLQFSTKRISKDCLLYTSPSPRDRTRSRMPSSAWKKKK